MLKYIRRNTKCFLLFNGLDDRDVQCVARDNAKGLTNKQFADIYQAATEKPYSFMTLDKTAKHYPQMYRRGFDEFLVT